MPNDDLLPDIHEGEQETLGSPSPKPPSSLFSTVLFLLVIILIACVVALAFFGQQKLQKINQQFSALQAKDTAFEQTQQQLQLLSNKVVLQSKMLKTVKHNLTQVNNIVMNSQNTWVLAEATYLLQLASLSLNYEKNISVTITLLQLADQRLINVNDPRLVPVKAAIATDITALQAVDKYDVANLYLKLQALQTESLSLPLVKVTYHPSRQGNLLAASAQEHASSFGGKAWDSTVGALSQLVLVRHHNTPLKPLLAASQAQLLHQTLYGLFSQAKWAALHQQTKIYQSSLSEISKLMQMYFQLNPQAASIVTTVQSLAKMDLTPILPNLNNTLTALDKYRKQILMTASTTKNKPKQKQQAQLQPQGQAS